MSIIRARSALLLPCAVLCLAAFAFCSSGSTPQGFDRRIYQAALAATDELAGPRPGGPIELAALRRFRSLFADFTEEGMRRSAGRVYADEAYFNDTIKTVRGARAIGDYLAHSAGQVHAVRVEMKDTARSGRDYYFRWSMDIRFEEDSEPIRSIGISHVRFDSQGRVVLHQDFWDSANGLFDHLPGSGFFLRFYRNRL